MSTISPTDFDSLEIQQQYNDINNRWDLAAETDWDNENSSARLFERSRIKALAGMIHFKPVMHRFYFRCEMIDKIGGSVYLSVFYSLLIFSSFPVHKPQHVLIFR